VDEQQQRLLASIEEAFRGVELGDGVSLHETRVIDDYGDAEERQAARVGDEKHDWRKLIDDPNLTKCARGQGFCFFDAMGFRFHLPACLVTLVKDPYVENEIWELLESVLFCLTHSSDHNLKVLAILSGVQRACVCDVLCYLREKLELKDEALDRALERYWQ
jgi:hypothetical protein